MSVRCRPVYRIGSLKLAPLHLSATTRIRRHRPLAETVGGVGVRRIANYNSSLMTSPFSSIGTEWAAGSLRRAVGIDAKRSISQVVSESC